jgi:L-amino acid N-acyltransferase YncA
MLRIFCGVGQDLSLRSGERKDPLNVRAQQVRLRIRDLRPGDWPEVAEIFEAGIRTRNATFETVVPAWEEWNAGHLARPRLVAVEGGDSAVVGWAALAPVSARACYAGVAEDSVYVARGRQGRGVGRTLLERLVRDAEAAGLWTIQTSIFPENRASLAVHLRCGFRIVGIRERIARLDGAWRDSLLLERRAGAVPSQTPTHPGNETSRVAAAGAQDCADFAPISGSAGTA